jgi:hypothetical protein
LTDDVLAEVDGVAHNFEGESVLGHAGDDGEVAFGATSDDHVVVVETSESAVAIVEFNFGSLQVDPLDALGAAAYSREHLAKRGGGCVGIDGGSGDIGQQRMKDHVVFAAEEENFTLGRAQLCAKSFCELNGSKSSADDYHSDWLHFFAPKAESNGTAGLLAKLVPQLPPDRKRHYGFLPQDRRREIPRISETCELYSKRAAELL